MRKNSILIRKCFFEKIQDFEAGRYKSFLILMLNYAFDGIEPDMSEMGYVERTIFLEEKEFIDCQSEERC